MAIVDLTEQQLLINGSVQSEWIWKKLSSSNTMLELFKNSNYNCSGLIKSNTGRLQAMMFLSSFLNSGNRRRIHHANSMVTNFYNSFRPIIYFSIPGTNLSQIKKNIVLPSNCSTRANSKIESGFFSS